MLAGSSGDPPPESIVAAITSRLGSSGGGVRSSSVFGGLLNTILEGSEAQSTASGLTVTDVDSSERSTGIDSLIADDLSTASGFPTSSLINDLANALTVIGPIGSTFGSAIGDIPSFGPPIFETLADPTFSQNTASDATVDPTTVVSDIDPFAVPAGIDPPSEAVGITADGTSLPAPALASSPSIDNVESSDSTVAAEVESSGSPGSLDVISDSLLSELEDDDTQVFDI
jgi:hypothetical protein